MFGISTTEIIVILIVALVVIGPDKLPMIARTIGKVTRDLRQATREIQASLEVEDVRRTIKQKITEEKRAILDGLEPKEEVAEAAVEQHDSASKKGDENE